MGLNKDQEVILHQMRQPTTTAFIEMAKAKARKKTAEEHERIRKITEPICEEFFKTDEYKSGDKMISGYTTCCDIFEMCGTSGWVIFLIIVLVLGVLAGGAAAFWFFYGKRKFGGKEEMVEENIESTDIENPKSVIEIPIGTH